jgi:hypothetical protein
MRPRFFLQALALELIAFAAVVVSPIAAEAQGPKRGGTLRVA